MIEFGPRQMPDERYEILMCWNDVDFRGPANTLGILPEQAIDVRWSIQDAVACCGMYWVQSDMVDLVSRSARTLPPEVRLIPELLPCRNGMAAFQSPLTIKGKLVDAISWQPVVRNYDSAPDGPRFVIANSTDDEPSFAELWVFTYAKHDHRWRPGGLGSWDFGAATPTDDIELGFAVLFALFALIQSPGVADEVEHPQERHIRKRSQRAGLTTDAVRVIRLRRHESNGHHDGESHYHHRWIVSGHWRSQPYGPGRSQRKPVWIMPHVKGPEGAPMLTGEKVRVL